MHTATDTCDDLLCSGGMCACEGSEDSRTSNSGLLPVTVISSRFLDSRSPLYQLNVPGVCTPLYQLSSAQTIYSSSSPNSPTSPTGNIRSDFLCNHYYCLLWQSLNMWTSLNHVCEVVFISDSKKLN